MGDSNNSVVDTSGHHVSTRPAKRMGPSGTLEVVVAAENPAAIASARTFRRESEVWADVANEPEFSSRSARIPTVWIRTLFERHFLTSH